MDVSLASYYSLSMNKILKLAHRVLGRLDILTKTDSACELLLLLKLLSVLVLVSLYEKNKSFVHR